VSLETAPRTKLNIKHGVHNGLKKPESLLRLKWLLHDSILLDRLATDEMILNDPFENRWITFAVPGPLRIDYCDRAGVAYSKAIRFRSKDTTTLIKLELLQSFFEVVPGLVGALSIATLILALIATEKDVSPRLRDAKVLSNLF
jgi:hypothetical protein